MKSPAWLLLALSMVFLEGCVSNGQMDALTSSSFGFNVSETNPHACEGISGIPARDTCYNTVALNTGDYGICDRITSTSQKDICYSGVAHGTGNASICEYISDNATKGDCIKQVA